MVQDLRARYHGRDDYVNRIRIAAQDLVARGFLLSDDAAVIVEEAASSKLFAGSPDRVDDAQRPAQTTLLTRSRNLQ